MTSRTILILGLSISALALFIACSDDTTGNASSSGGGTGTSGFKQCPSQGSSSCTEAESKPYSDCVLEKCESAYTQCFGSGFKSGSFGGACGPYITCTQKCGCGDTACLTACKPDDGCTSCIQSSGIGTCSQTCTPPACASTSSSSSTSSTSGSTGGGTCADLLACCNKITDTSQKSSCTQAHTSAAGSDSTCGTYYNAFKTLCP